MRLVKALFQFLIVQLKVPQGAALPISLKFQFLIVQLKAIWIFCYEDFPYVSIPYSTIKSFTNVPYKVGTWLFQFLIVQLKE